MSDRSKVWLRRILGTYIPRLLIIFFILALIAYLIFVISEPIIEIIGENTPAEVATHLDRANVITTLVGLVLAFLFLTTLPAWIVINFRFARFNSLRLRILEDLWLCDLGTEELKGRLNIFEEQNSYWAFFWPTAFALLPLIVFWWLTLAPQGIFGLYEWLSSPVDGVFSGQAELFRRLDVARYIGFISTSATPVTWAFLGSYFYLLSVLIRRWVLSDVTAGLLWRLNIRLGVVLIIGMLMQLFSTQIDARVLAVFAFLFGVVPESGFRWFVDIATGFLPNRSQSSEAENVVRTVFTRSDLYDIERLNFWQIDRLIDDGIESVQNLATRDILQMLVKVRFDTQRLLDWIDQALLIHHVGIERIKDFRRACIFTASDFLDALAQPSDALPNPTNQSMPYYPYSSDKIDHMVTALKSQHKENGQLLLTKEVVENLVTSLLQGPNYSLIRSYWMNTCSPKMRDCRLQKLREEIMKEPADSPLREAFGLPLILR